MKVLYVIMLGLTLSRGAYISIILTLLAYYLFTNKRVVDLSKAKSIIITTFMLVALSAVASMTLGLNITESINGRFESAIEDQGSGRIGLWQGALNTFENYPILGIGANSSYSYNDEKYGHMNYSHNTYLDVMSELGIIGFTIFICGVYFTIRLAHKARKHSGGFALILFFGILFQITFLSLMVNELYLVGILIVYLWGRNNYLAEYRPEKSVSSE